MHIQADIMCAISSGANVLISGGNSSARTALARFIHEQDRTTNGSLVVLDEWVLDRGLKGHCGRVSRAGAPRRTLFIEELARLSRIAQDELMRMIESLGAMSAGDAPDTRIISGTAQHLAGLLSPAFDARLFYRLNTIHVALGEASGLARPYSIH